jgi:hypothetical protein
MAVRFNWIEEASVKEVLDKANVHVQAVREVV